MGRKKVLGKCASCGNTLMQDVHSGLDPKPWTDVEIWCLGSCGTKWRSGRQYKFSSVVELLKRIAKDVKAFKNLVK